MTTKHMYTSVRTSLSLLLRVTHDFNAHHLDPGGTCGNTGALMLAHSASLKMGTLLLVAIKLGQVLCLQPTAAVLDSRRSYGSGKHNKNNFTPRSQNVANTTCLLQASLQPHSLTSKTLDALLIMSYLAGLLHLRGRCYVGSRCRILLDIIKAQC